jgi:hypothetical protein
MIPLDVDALLATMAMESPFGDVTSVVGVTPPLISSNHAEKRPASPVTPPDQQWCNRCNRPQTGLSDRMAVTPATPGHVGRCISHGVSQVIATARVVDTATRVTPVTPLKERRAMMLARRGVAGSCSHQAHIPPPPPPYPGHPVGTPFRPGHQVWLYRWDDQTPRFDAPVTIVQLRTLPTGERDIGWCDAAGALSWHNARLAVAVETPEVHRHP